MLPSKFCFENLKLLIHSNATDDQVFFLITNYQKGQELLTLTLAHSLHIGSIRIL